jgi:hypothetical protein
VWNKTVTTAADRALLFGVISGWWILSASHFCLRILMFEYSNYVLPFIFSTMVLFLLGIYLLRYRDKVETAELFSLQNFAMGIWTLCYALELATPTFEGKIFWAKVKYLGSTTGPVLWFIFSLYYTNHRR